MMFANFMNFVAENDMRIVDCTQYSVDNEKNNNMKFTYLLLLNYNYTVNIFFKT